MGLSVFILGISIGFASAILYVILTKPKFIELDVDEKDLLERSDNSFSNEFIDIPATKVVAIRKSNNSRKVRRTPKPSKTKIFQ